MIVKRMVLAVVAGLALAACSGGGDGGGGGPVDPGPQPNPEPVASATVTTGASSFTPREVHLKLGGTVTWSIGDVAHNVIFNRVTGAPADIDVTRNTQISRTFGTAGSFPYDCTLHAGMNGTVHVK